MTKKQIFTHKVVIFRYIFFFIPLILKLGNKYQRSSVRENDVKLQMKWVFTLKDLNILMRLKIHKFT